MIDRLTLVLSSVEADPIVSLRSVTLPLERLDMGARVLDAAAAGGVTEGPVVASIRSHLDPLIVLVGEHDVVPPPFSPDIRQRIGYSIGVLLGLRARLRDHQPRLRTKPILAMGDTALEDLKARWTAFRDDPSLEDLDRLHHASVSMREFYWVLGLDGSNPRIRSLGRLCHLIERAMDRHSDPTDVPSMMRELTAAANDLCRPTRGEHRQWLESVLA